MCFRRTIRLGIVVLVATLAWTSSLWAIDDSVKGAVRDLSSQGKEDYDAGRFDAAAEKFQRAYATIQVPTLALWHARCSAKLGKLVGASETYRRALQLAPNDLWIGNTQQEAQADALKELDALIPRIPKLRIVAVGAQPNEVATTVDGTPMPSALLGVERPTDPGSRRIIGRRGGQVVDVVVELAEGETKEVPLAFDRKSASVSDPGKPTLLRASNHGAGDSSASEAHGSTLRTLGYVGIGVGTVGALVGTVAGILVVKRYSDLEAGCPNDTCDPARTIQSSLDTYNTLRTAALAGFIVGGVGLAAGTTLILLSPSPDARVGLLVGPTSAGIHGVF